MGCEVGLRSKKGKGNPSPKRGQIKAKIFALLLKKLKVFMMMAFKVPKKISGNKIA